MVGKFMRKTSWAALFLVCAAAFATLAAAPAPQGSGYHLLKKVVLGGEGGWDYLSADPGSHRFFISRGTHIVVTDADGTVVGDIPNVQGTHGAQLVPEFGRGFSSNGRSNSVTIFDLKTLATISEVKLPAADGPDGFMYDPASKNVYVFNGRSHDATAVNAKTGEVAGTVPLGGKPEAAQADGAGHAWVNIEDKAQLVEFDSKEFKVLNTWALPTCEEPTGMAIDTAHKRLFIGCHSKVMLVTDYAGKVVASVPIGQGVDAASFDPATQFAFVSCGDGTITVTHEDSPDKYTVVETISTQRGARTMTLDTANHRLLTVTADFGPPPAPTAENPNPRPVPVTGTFTALIYGR
jgi:DNA-binding beta-propeller fold protein YncE